ncbi:hypothetical protein D3C73_1478470 [compost metagenome]
MKTIFAGRKLEVVYTAPGGADYGEYQIHRATLNGAVVTLQRVSEAVVIPRAVLEGLPEDRIHRLEVGLA